MNVCVIGHFGDGAVFRDGQTIKTLNLEKVLRMYSSQGLSVKKVDTYLLKKNKIKFITELIKGIVSSKKIIICVSKGGRKIFFPLMYVLNKLFKKQIYHCAIGGRLYDEANDNAKVKKYISCFEKNWVESTALAQRLLTIGVKNAEYLPNFKDLPVLTQDDIKSPIHEPMKFCIFSRVSAEKGVGDAIDAVKNVNIKYGQVKATLDIYGAVEEKYKAELEQKVKENGEYVKYCGAVAPEKSVDVLSAYDVLLFPTRYRREGIPGTIIDALCTGLPIISRKWLYCDEMLEHNKTGYCYDFEKPELLEYYIEKAIENPSKIIEMRLNCLKNSEKYRMNTAAQQIEKEIFN